MRETYKKGGPTAGKVEKGHAKYGSEVGPGEEDGTEQGESLHGGAVVLGGMGDVFLLLGYL